MEYSEQSSGWRRFSTYRSRIGLGLPTSIASASPSDGTDCVLVLVLLRWTRRRVAGFGLFARNEVVETHVKRGEDGRHR